MNVDILKKSGLSIKFDSDDPNTQPTDNDNNSNFLDDFSLIFYYFLNNKDK